MRLVELRLLRTPGIRDAFTLAPSAGLNLVTGPNGAGKSSLCRAVLALLWPDVISEEPFTAEAEFELEGRRLSVARQDLDSPVWSASRPDLGSDHLAGRYRLGVLDLLGSDPHGDPLAHEIRKHMAGGFDLEAIRQDLFEAGTGRSEHTTLNKAAAVVTRLRTQQRNLATEQDRLTSLRQTRDLAGQARDRKAILELVRDLAEQMEAQKNAATRLQEMPPATEHVRAEDPEKLAHLRRLENGLTDQIEKYATSLDETEKELADLDKTRGARDLSLDLLKKRLATLGDLVSGVRQAEREANDKRLAEILGETPTRTAAWPFGIATVIGAVLIALSLSLSLPGTLWPRVVFALGITAGTVGLWGWATRPRDAGQAVLIQEKRRELASKTDYLETCRRQRDKALADFNAALEQVGVPAVADVEEAKQFLEDCETNRNRLNELKTALKGDEVNLKRDRKDLACRRAEIGMIFDRLALPDERDADSEVARLLEIKPSFDQISKDRDIADREIDRLRKGIAGGASLLHKGESPEMPGKALEELIDQEGTLAGELGELEKNLARIEAAIHQAQGGHDLQEAMAEQETARAALAAVRQANREAALGHLLLDRMAHQHEMESRPRILEQAGEFFGLFTGHRYELKLAARGGGKDRFQAVPEDSVKPKELHELSDGTRAQLLLAVKLAFITAEEISARPPIFLDDSLASADPERFAAVAVSLGRLAAEQDRQIFYLTPDPADAAAFQRALAAAGLPAACHIDLAEVRSIAGAADPELLDPANLPDNIMAPDPAGMTAAQYAAALLVSRPDPWAPRGGLHVFFLLHDDLDLVRRLVDGNGETLQRFAGMKEILLAADQITLDEAATIGARGEVWSAWLDGWLIGRAQPLSREFLKDSEAVSKNYLEPVTAVLKECRWDGAGLLGAIEKKKVKGFRANKLAQLRRELEDADLLDPRTQLTDDELINHTLDRVKPLLASGRLDLQKVRTLALTFVRLIES